MYRDEIYLKMGVSREFFEKRSQAYNKQGGGGLKPSCGVNA